MRELTIGLAVLAMVACTGTATAACAPACDLNGDGLRGSLLDYHTFLGAFGTKKGEPKFVATADLDGNGSVGGSDFGLLSKFCPLEDVR